MTVIKIMSLQLVVVLLCITTVMGKLKWSNYTQKLDHFECDESDLCNFTFPQLVSVSDSHWAGPGAPIFAVLGGLTELGFHVNQYGILARAAVKFKAMSIEITHRFRQQSVPLGSINLTMRDHRIRERLSIDQVLEDYANIIQSLKFNLSAQNSPVIVVGYGYGGALATWFRLKYPHIAIGALASSTPLFYYGSRIPMDGYCDIISNDYQLADPECYEAISDSWAIIEGTAKEPNGLAKLSQMFNTCRPIKSLNEVKGWFSQFYSYKAQFDNFKNIDIRSVCFSLTGGQSNINEGLYTVLYDQMVGGDCFDTTITELYSPFEPSDNSTLVWDWLRCTELIYPMGCQNRTMLPSWPFNMTRFERFCQQKFGVVARSHSSISFIGSQDVVVEALSKLGENIIFSNGLRDPFSSGAILSDISKTVVSITTTNGSFSWDLHPNTIDDPRWLVEAREKEIDIFREWINQFHHASKGSRNSAPNVLIIILVALMFMHL